jgi:hypothetical protein
MRYTIECWFPQGEGPEGVRYACAVRIEHRSLDEVLERLLNSDERYVILVEEEERR